MFADAECREYANGEVKTVYVRINGGPYEFGDELNLGTFPDTLRIATPIEGDPPDTGYGVIIYTDFGSQRQPEPIQPGQIFECQAADPVDVTSFRKIWYGGE